MAKDKGQTSINIVHTSVLHQRLTITDGGPGLSIGTLPGLSTGTLPAISV